MNWKEERTQIKYTIKDTETLYEKFKSGKITEPYTNPLYYQRDYMLTIALYLHWYRQAYHHPNSNDDTSPFLEKLELQV